MLTQKVILRIDKSKQKPLLDFLKSLDFVEIENLDNEVIEEKFIKGDFKKNENPLKKFAGIWKDTDLTFDKIRKEAWQRKK